MAAEAEREDRGALLRWLLCALPEGSLELPAGAASPSAVDVARIDVPWVLAQLEGATLAGAARLDLTLPGAARRAAPPPANRAKRLARYESILLCAFLGGELRGDAAERRLHELQRAFGLDGDAHDELWLQLQFATNDPGGDLGDGAPPRAAPPSEKCIDYRLELLREAVPRDFRTREAFVDWVQRQVSAYHRGFSAALGWAAVERQEEMEGFAEMVKAMSKNVIDVVVSWASDGADGEAFPHEAYADAVAACARTAEQVYDMLDDALDPRFRSDGAPRAARPYLCYVYPMNTVSALPVAIPAPSISRRLRRICAGAVRSCAGGLPGRWQRHRRVGGAADRRAAGASALLAVHQRSRRALGAGPDAAEALPPAVGAGAAGPRRLQGGTAAARGPG